MAVETWIERKYSRHVLSDEIAAVKTQIKAKNLRHKGLRN